MTLSSRVFNALVPAFSVADYAVVTKKLLRHLVTGEAMTFSRRQ